VEKHLAVVAAVADAWLGYFDNNIQDEKSFYNQKHSLNRNNVIYGQLL
jgi:hypothetical protein